MPRIVHLGFGNFHRAHQAWYTQLANALGGPQWSITGVSMNRTDLRDALKSNAFHYSLGLKGVDGLTIERMTVHDTVLVARETPKEVIQSIAMPETQIVSLTITEKGYSLDATGRLDLSAGAIKADLGSDQPIGAIGLLTRGLWQRSASIEPITVMSCDNLSGNGRLVKQAVHDFAEAAGWDMAGYLKANVSFPDSMVDRITPATTDRTVEQIEKLTGVPEPSPVITETFSEWVIEDHFAGARPDWHNVGAVFSTEVGAYEARKLRLLNASHSLLAYGGLLRGHDYVHEAISDPVLRQKVAALWQEAIATLPASIRTSSEAYCDALIARFEVPAIRHELRQIAADGSLKLPVRLFSAAEERRALKLASPALCDSIASWFAYASRNTFSADPQAELVNGLLFGHAPNADLYGQLIAVLNWQQTCPFEPNELAAAAQSWLE